MEASLDTNVIIHLYKANFQVILFKRFEKLKVYEFIRYHEMDNHATPEIIDQFDKDVDAEKIDLITDDYLISIGMYNVFQQHVKETRILFEPDSDVIPFAFYEILFLDYLEEGLTEDELLILP